MIVTPYLEDANTIFASVTVKQNPFITKTRVYKDQHKIKDFLGLRVSQQQVYHLTNP